jgi:hypothetical protein
MGAPHNLWEKKCKQGIHTECIWNSQAGRRHLAEGDARAHNLGKKTRGVGCENMVLHIYQ